MNKLITLLFFISASSMASITHLPPTELQCSVWGEKDEFVNIFIEEEIEGVDYEKGKYIINGKETQVLFSKFEPVFRGNTKRTMLDPQTLTSLGAYFISAEDEDDENSDVQVSYKIFGHVRPFGDCQIVE
jgi:hypothetical protein